MGLRYRLEQVPETLQEFELAADTRYWDGVELLCAGRTGGGVYLLGYVAEMLLKVSYCRYRGAGPPSLVGPMLGPARRSGRQLVPGIPHEGYHSLHFWLRLLLAERSARGEALPPDLRNGFHQRVRRLHQVWWVQSRYRMDRADRWSGPSALADVDWLRDNYTALWRRF